MRLLVLIFTFFVFPISALSIEYSSEECFWAGAAEVGLSLVGIPGAGYIYTRQYDKALVFGLGGNAALLHTREARLDDDYQDDPENYYRVTPAEESASGKNEIEIYLNRETWDADFYGGLFLNITFLKIWDFYTHDCEQSTEAYELLFSPLRFDHFYDNWMFWLPIAILAYNYQTFDRNNKVVYHLGNGLTSSRLRNDGYKLYTAVGIGEEMLFRGTIQNALYEYFKGSGMTPETSRHMAIFSSAALFGLAHSGQAGTANPLQAFGFGIYFGYVYMPTIDEFDLMTAIAIHSWWDVLIFYTLLNHAEFTESEKPVSIPIFEVGFRF